MDLEMTGLDPERERIIEIATIITDSDLNVVAEGPEIVIAQPAELLDGMDEWNTKHHTESGLLQRVRASRTTEAEAEETTLRFIGDWCDEKTAPLAGNSIHQDRRFLGRYMKRIDNFLHYRIIDVSSVKELARRWYPETAQRAPLKRNSHRALDDIRESIKELRYYRSSIFRSNG